jgi:hypothetical protein
LAAAFSSLVIITRSDGQLIAEATLYKEFRRDEPTRSENHAENTQGRRCNDQRD